jgi:hypothetical protein
MVFAVSFAGLGELGGGEAAGGKSRLGALPFLS